MDVSAGRCSAAEALRRYLSVGTGGTPTAIAFRRMVEAVTAA
jgi:hypothetical protein